MCCLLVLNAVTSTPPHGHNLEQLVTAKKFTAQKITAMADSKCQRLEYNNALTSCQDVHVVGAKHKERGAEHMKKLVKYFTERESEVARSLEERHNRLATNDELLELVFEDHEDEDLKMIKKWFSKKEVSGRRVICQPATTLGGNEKCSRSCHTS